MTIRGTELDPSAFQDPRHRGFVSELNKVLLQMSRAQQDYITVDPERGLVYLKGDLVLRDRGVNPTQQATPGVPGQLVRNGVQFFTKDGPVERTDTNWNETLSESSGVPTSRQIIAGLDLTGGGDLSVDRTISAETQLRVKPMVFGHGAATGDQYGKWADLTCTTSKGLRMRRDGTLVGISGQVELIAHASDGAVSMQMRVNDSSVISGTTATMTGNGIFTYEGTASAAFSAGDLLQPFLNFTGGLAGTILASAGVLEIIWTS